MTNTDYLSVPELPEHRFRPFNFGDFPGQSGKQIHAVKLFRNHPAPGFEGCCSEIKCGHHFLNDCAGNNFAFPISKHGNSDPSLEKAAFLTPHGHIVRSIPDSTFCSRCTCRHTRLFFSHFTWSAIIAGEENHGVLFKTVFTKFGHHSAHCVVNGFDQCQAHPSAVISPIIIMWIIELGKFLVIGIRLFDQRDVRSIERQVEKERLISSLTEVDKRFTVLTLKDHTVGDAFGQALPALRFHRLSIEREIG